MSIVKRTILLVLTAALMFGTVCYATAPQVIPDATSSQKITFEEGIEAAVIEAFSGLADEVAPEVVAAITPEVDVIADNIKTSVLAIKETKDTIETKGFVLDASAYPPAEVINQIPAQALAQVRAQVQAEIQTSIAADFKKSEEVITEQVKSLVKAAAPKLIEELEPQLKALIPKIHYIIESRIEERIEEKILLALPDLMPLIPEDMAKLSPEEIAAKMKSAIKLKVEAVVRPDFEAKIKEQVDAIMVEKIKKPIEEKFQPRMLSLNTTVYDQYIDQLPSYLERVVTKDTIKAIVSQNVADLQAKLPTLVENSRAELDAQINQYIANTIEKEAKVYVGNSYVKAPIQPKTVNNKLLVPFRAIATALGATVEWKYKERQVVMTKGDKTIILTLDSNIVLVNGEKKTIDVATQLAKDEANPGISHTVVPLRFIAETFDMDVNWQKEWKMVTIEEKN